jgi:hypothetical protein
MEKSGKEKKEKCPQNPGLYCLVGFPFILGFHLIFPAGFVLIR